MKNLQIRSSAKILRRGIKSDTASLTYGGHYMKLYQTNQALNELLSQIQPDPETGELPDNTDELIEQINALQADKADILKWIAQEILNIRAEIPGIKAEEDRLYKYRKNKEDVIERLINILDRECGGENADFGIAKLSHRTTTSTDVTDPDKAIEFLESSGHDDALKYKKPDVDRLKVKQLIKQGINVPGAELKNKISVSLR